MTREQAIQILKYNSNVIHKTINGETDPNEVEALDIAISALEHPERNVVAIVPCGDAISRQATINAVKRIHPVDTDYDCTLYDKVDVMYVLDEMPSVTPQEPRWIPVSEKLPEPFTFVNATCRSLVDDRENWVVETLYLPIPKENNKHGYSDWGNIPMLNWGEAEVIAWVERIIPQPYKAEIEPQESEE